MSYCSAWDNEFRRNNIWLMPVLSNATHKKCNCRGPESDTAIAAHIARSQGPSGPNSEYLLKLAAALREMNEHDEHVFAIEQALLKL